MKQYIEVGYALSNRVKCQNCLQNIVKDDIRIGHVLTRPPGFGFDKKIWYHLLCLTSIKGDRNQDLDIVNIHSLKEGDQQKVRQKVDQIKKSSYQKKDQKEVKYLSKQEHFQNYVKIQKDLHFNQKLRQQAMFFQKMDQTDEQW
ncbi:unnamed protein product (macronuclear) [Paramecium tetraurelia]|uniref:PARP-type domain-containing protein n=1 Tax=Paramecium tetraurelia TaxID=5888 RepID=A0DL72_PARTE|nr:uncharacterized protein GSPATT00018106001 [Paramecium tetraurelia]CAK83789.1 unnamed protein product [Paramecium tetraurelia]|eukprot:XP_001451186.1 hypothetical protein (macronuclear) [Paramecium tetraurelia strain d4-2]